jgi:uncharacterized RDD family membrane protein YckC
MRSPEGVEIELPIATPAPRIAAYAIDFALVAGLAFTFFIVFLIGSSHATWVTDQMQEWVKANADGDARSAQVALGSFLVVILIALTFGELVYFSLWESLTRGLTPGKYVMRLRVVGPNGQPIDFKTAVLRNLLRIVDVLPASYCVGLIAIILSKRSQRLGDVAAGSLVIRTDRVERPREPELPEGLEPLALSREQLARLGTRELTLVRSALRRLEGAGIARPAVIDQVADAIATRLELSPEERHDPVRLLQRTLLTAQRAQRH